VNFKLKLGRGQIGVDGRRKDKGLLSLTLEEIKSMPDIGKLNFVDYLPHSLLRKR
jgi:hypothetical protein